MSLGSTTTVRRLNAFAELSGETTTFSGAARYSLDTSARDAMGRIATKTEVLNDGSGSTTLRTDFEYDLRGRVSEVYESSTAAMRGALAREYTYDDNGNRLSVLDGSGAVVESGVYDGQDRLIEYVRDGTTARYTYRDRGALWTKSVGSDVTEYEYDVWGNLRSVDLPESVDPGAADIEYTVDGQNRRVGKWRNGELVQELLYQDQLNPVAVRDRADGSSPWTTKRFVYASRPNVPDFMVVNETDTFRLLVDQVGSVRAVVNVDTGVVAQVIDYDEFGRILSDTNPGFQPFGFAGGLYDQDTDLVRFGARDYDPETGRWTSKDPILFEGGLTNLYSYVGSDPVNLTDASGLCSDALLSNFLTGAAYGVVGAAAVAVGAGFAAAFLPVGVVTGGLVATASIGIAVLAVESGYAIAAGDWNRVAFNTGALAGGGLYGRFSGRATAQAINGIRSPRWSMRSDLSQRYNSSLGTLGQWISTGFNPGSAGVAVGVTGAGGATRTR